MMIDPNNFNIVSYSGAQLFFDKNHSFHEHFGHKLKTTKFPYYKSFLLYLADNPDTRIFFTLDENVKPFKKNGIDFLINMQSYCDFCKAIQNNTQGRAKAFLGQNLDLNSISFTEEQKNDFIKANASEGNILEVLKTLSPSTQQRITRSIDTINHVDGDQADKVTEITSDEFIDSLSRFLSDGNVQSALYSNLPQIQINILKDNLEFIRNNLDKNEIHIQSWIDEDKGKYRKRRCLVFGLEYVDPVSQGVVAGKRFDILAEQDLNHHVIIELKSPKDNIFKIEEEETAAGGTSTTYNFSDSLSRAIPQVLGYKKMYENSQGEELEKFGIKVAKPVSKCIIIIGTRKNDLIWKENFDRINSCLNGIELLTYDDLIDKMENTIRNLEVNLV